MSDTEAILNAITNLDQKMEKGFIRAYDEIASVCERIEPLEKDKIERDALSCAEEKEGVNWGKVKTGAAIVASGALTIAALKLILVNWHTLIP